MIEMTLKSRLMNVIDCYDDNMISKYVQVINSAIKECKDLLSLMCYKITRNFLLNWVAQLLKYLVIITILILNNVALTDVVADMLKTVKTIERIQLIVDVMIMMWHWDDVSMNKQKNREIAENMML